MILGVCRRYTSVGLHYSYQDIPTAEALAAMLEKSPITHAAQVRVRYTHLHSHSPVTLMCWVADHGRKLESGFSHST